MVCAKRRNVLRSSCFRLFLTLVCSLLRSPVVFPHVCLDATVSGAHHNLHLLERAPHGAAGVRPGESVDTLNPPPRIRSQRLLPASIYVVVILEHPVRALRFLARALAPLKFRHTICNDDSQGIVVAVAWLSSSLSCVSLGISLLVCVAAISILLSVHTDVVSRVAGICCC